MHATHLVLLALSGLTLGLPTFSREARQAQIRSLINLSPVLAPKLNLGQLFGCLGLGISACDPINVNGTQNADNNDGNTKKSSASSTSNDGGNSGSSGGGNSGSSGSLVNIAPVIAPDINFSNQNSCIGVGVSVCDPINVNGEQNSNNDDEKN